MPTYNLEKMQTLLKDFYCLTGVKVCIYDSAENELCYYPKKRCAFCTLLRESQELDELCVSCDRKGFAECRKTHKQYVYTCHAGLLECISPIVYENKIIGFIVIGQIRTSELTNFNKIYEQLPINNRKKLSLLFNELPITDMNKINSAINILDACTGYEYLKGLVHSGENKIDVLIANFINNNLNGDLSVKNICFRFHLSHSEIYSVFNEYFNATPAEYIKQRRLNHACKLLKTTDYPVNKIAGLCGIPDYNYFTKVFKKTFKITPKEFRKS